MEQLAAEIHYHPESVRRAIRQGRIHALPFGVGWRIPATEAARILAMGLPYRKQMVSNAGPVHAKGKVMA